MLQLINANAAQGASGTSSDAALPVANASAVQADTAFELQLAEAGQALPELPEALLAALPAEPQEAPLEVDAERWLNSMLAQHEVSIEVREAEAEPVFTLPDVASVLSDEEEPVLPKALHAPQQTDETGTEPSVQAPVAVVQAQVPAAEVAQVTAPVQAATARPELQGQSAQVAPLPAALADVGSASGLAAAPVDTALTATQTVDMPVPGAAVETVATQQPAQLERSLTLKAPQAQWGEQMLQSLRESVDLQINQRVQNATIRLDPPELGSLEIFLSHESGRITVQLSASNAEVARLLQQTSDRLRQELVAQNFVQVNVQVSADAQGGRQQGQAARHALPGEEQVMAAHDADQERSNSQDSASDVLVTV